MRTTMLGLLAIFLSVTSCSSDKKNTTAAQTPIQNIKKVPLDSNDLKKRKLFGTVKEVSIETYTATIDSGIVRYGTRTEIDGDQDSNCKLIFNKDGFLIEETKYDENGNTVYSTSFFYDANRYLTGKMYTGIENPKRATITFEYNTAGQLTKRIYPTGIDERRREDINIYDQRGNLIEQALRGKSFCTYQYNDKNQLIGVNYNDTGNTKRIYTYDSEGNKTEMKESFRAVPVSNPGYDVLRIFNYSYNEQEKVIEEVAYFDNESDGKRLERYNKNGVLIESKYFNTDGKLTSIYSWKYDAYDNPLSQIGGNNGSNEYSRKWEYGYDDTGNWISNLCTENQVPQHIVNRKISYYQN